VSTRPGPDIGLRPTPLPYRGPSESPRPIEEVLDRHRVGLLTFTASVLAFVFGIALPLLGYRLNADPHRLFKVIAGGAIFSVFVARPTWVPYFLCLIFPFANWLPKSPVPLLNSMNLLVVAAVFGIFAMTLRHKIRPIVPGMLNAPYFAFLFLAAFSVLTGSFLWPDRGGGGPERLRSFWNVLAGLLVYVTTTHLIVDRKQVWRLVAFLIIGSTIGVLGPIREVAAAGLGTRTGGGIGEINRMGAFLAFTSVFAFSMLGAYGGLAKAATGVAGIITFAAMVFPNSRGAYIGFLLAAFPQAIRRSIVGTVLLIGLLGVGYLVAPSFVKSRITETVQAGEGSDRVDSLDKTSGGRLTIWGRAFTVIKENPLIGVGWGNLQQATGLTGGNFKHVHSLYLQTSGEMGLPALVVLFWLMITGWRMGGRLSRRGGKTAALGRAYQGVIICLMVSNLFGQRFLDFSLAGFFFTLSGCVALEERFTRPEAMEERG